MNLAYEALFLEPFVSFEAGSSSEYSSDNEESAARLFVSPGIFFLKLSLYAFGLRCRSGGATAT